MNKLMSLHVKNIALIDDVEIELGDGLNILTGETGAGKSIIIDAVNFALGKRMPKQVVRDGEAYALCELVFSLDDEKTLKMISDMDIPIDDGNIILQRKVINGKNVCKCNGESVSAATVQEISSLLIDIHGQHEHQSLLNKKNHRVILDDFCQMGEDWKNDSYVNCSTTEKLDNDTSYVNQDEIKTLIDAVWVDKANASSIKTMLEKYYVNYNEKVSEYEKAKSEYGNRGRDIDYARFVIEEIDSAALTDGEDEELENRFKKMQKAQKIAVSIEEIKSAIMDEVCGAERAISVSSAAARDISSNDEDATSLYDEIMQIEDMLSGFVKDIESYEKSLMFSTEEYAECEERLNEINRLKSKYGDSISEIFATRDREEENLKKLEDYDCYLENLENQCEELKKSLVILCEKMSDLRTKEGSILEKDICESLKGLNFLDARFEIKIESDREKITKHGFDDVEFLISTNPGEDLKPLTQVASGGELSRIMLALKAVLAKRDSIGTLIFDEIDTGISGVTAALVADKMSLIAKNHQVICVTHLPQIASHADTHFEISKSVDEGHTSTKVRELTYDESVRELARMMGDVSITETAIQNAKEMKDRNGFKA